MTLPFWSTLGMAGLLAGESMGGKDRQTRTHLALDFHSQSGFSSTVFPCFNNVRFHVSGMPYKGVVKETVRKVFLSRIFAVPKKASEKARLILLLSRLNSYMKTVFRFALFHPANKTATQTT